MFQDFLGTFPEVLWFHKENGREWNRVTLAVSQVLDVKRDSIFLVWSGINIAGPESRKTDAFVDCGIGDCSSVRGAE